MTIFIIDIGKNNYLFALTFLHCLYTYLNTVFFGYFYIVQSNTTGIRKQIILFKKIKIKIMYMSIKVYN